MNKFKNVVIILIMAAMLVLFAACGPTGGDDDGGLDEVKTTTVSGVVTIGDKGVSGVTVSIADLNKSDTTDGNGAYQLTEVKSGTYQLSFKSTKHNINKSVPIVVSGSPITHDLSFDNQISEAEVFVDNLNNTGIQAKDTIEGQVVEIEEQLNTNINPYMQSFVFKTGMIYNNINKVFEAQGDLNSRMDNGMLYPGEYTLDFTNEPTAITEKPLKLSDIEKDDTWSWVIDKTALNKGAKIQESTTITLTNLYDIMYVDPTSGEHIIDFSRANFTYNQALAYGTEKYSAAIDFTLASNSTQTIKTTDNEGNTVVFIIPDNAILVLKGEINDNVTIESGDMNYIPLKKAVLDAELAFDVNSNTSTKGLAFTGMFSCDVMELNGDLEVEFSHFPTYETLSWNNPPIPSFISLSGSFTLKDLITFSDGFTIKMREFTMPDQIKVPVLESFTTNSKIDFLQAPVTTISGSLDITPDYSNAVEPYQPETEDNYIKGTISFTGKYEKDGFAPITLTLTLSRVGYESVTAGAKYEFDKDKYIDVNVTYANSKLTFEGSNEKLSLIMQIDESLEYPEETKIGEIRDTSGEYILGEIYILDGIPTVNYPDGKVASLLL